MAAALVAGSLVVLAFSRRITHGMIGGALGALAALVVLYLTLLVTAQVASLAWPGAEAAGRGFAGG
jgi:hypothetical protein